MMRKCVVNVSTGEQYQRGMLRLSQKLLELDPTINQQFWSIIPPSWPSHAAKPYAFKAYALKEAAPSTDLILWADAAVLPIRSLAPLWQKIEKEGYWIAENGWTNYEWTADSAYADLFPGIPIEEAREINKKFSQVVATSFGLNLRSEIGAEFLKEYIRLADTNAFCGPWSNTNNPNHWPQDPSRMGDCGPPDVLGHRHDQTAAAVIAWRLGMKLTQCPAIFAYPPAHESTILLAVGA